VLGLPVSGGKTAANAGAVQSKGQQGQPAQMK